MSQLMPAVEAQLGGGRATRDLRDDVKRCHDRGYSGWFMLWGPLRAAVVLGIVGIVIALAVVLLSPDLAQSSRSMAGPAFKAAGADILGMPILAGAITAILAAVLWYPAAIGFAPGMIGPNRYGPNPHGSSQASLPRSEEKHHTRGERLKR
jgi:uncharacterized membrane protein YhaH (DUF805 family)